MHAELHAWQDCIIRGPMWSGCSREDVGVIAKARPNIACVSRRTVRETLRGETGF